MALQLKYSSGAIPGKPLKRKSTEDETMNSQEIGNFWQSGRPWLKYLEDRKLMVCSWCTVSVSPSVPRDISFFKGSNNSKISTIKDHESSTHHVRISPRFNMPIEKSEGAKCVLQKY